MFVAYLRVSTQRQGASGLGLDAQREAVERYAGSVNQAVIATFTEIESGAVKQRPELAAALDMCRRRKAVLLIARLDRLSRSLSFVAQLLDANVEIRAADMPEANRMMLQMLAVFAEHERRLIGARTKAALAAAKARGVQLGRQGKVLAERHRTAAVSYALEIEPHIFRARSAGATTCQSIAAFLNVQGLPSREGGCWHPASVGRVLRRLEADQPHL
ncbi:MAG: recombinase family protein [Hyphomicrobiaceae bacterium]